MKRRNVLQLLPLLAGSLSLPTFIKDKDRTKPVFVLVHGAWHGGWCWKKIKTLLIKKGYELLNLITYFTTGEKETRAWTIGRGWTAPKAGTVIHGDFEEKFIRAEVIEWDRLIDAGSFASAREKGLLRTEGKEYIVKDGDVMEFRI